MAGSKFLFSEKFKVRRKAKDDWYDVLLQTDTRLFVDPFRIYADDSGIWKGAHAELVDFFNLVLELMAKASLNPKSAHWRAAANLLMFPEPIEFCLGYSKESKGGQGTAKKTRDNMLKAGALAIKAGLDHVEHFEEMALFQGRVGPDLVSDIACNVLKSRFIKYTQAVCKRHKGIKTKRIPIKHASWSRAGRRWENDSVELPYNKWTNSAVILVPEDFLRELPTVEGDEFWEYAFAYEAENIKGEFEYDVARNVDSETIAKLARRNPELVKKYVARYESAVPRPYDVERDPRGLVNWYQAGKELGSKVKTVGQPTTQAAFCKFVESLCNEFVWATEQRGGWKLLWNPDGSPRAESSVQQLFHIAMLGYCKSHDIDLSPEASSGRGPVDFKFSAGWTRRAVVEVKLVNNSSFWHGLSSQLTTYIDAEGVKCGYFLAVRYHKNDFLKARTKAVERKARELSTKLGYKIVPIFVDARPKKSASKVRPKKGKS
jgi:hypothetical protein